MYVMKLLSFAVCPSACPGTQLYDNFESNGE
jgi:hypothetical protein